jgi:hypothetical protein
VREIATRLKVGKTALYERSGPEQAGHPPHDHREMAQVAAGDRSAESASFIVPSPHGCIDRAKIDRELIAAPIGVRMQFSWGPPSGATHENLHTDLGLVFIKLSRSGVGIGV